MPRTFMNERNALSRRELLSLGAAAAATSWVADPRDASAQSTPAQFDGAKTRALVVGILQWQDGRFRGFPQEGRRDAVLVETR